MNASEAYKAGKLNDAIDLQLKEVKAHPADHGKRLFLFELLAYAGDLERAKKHIEIIQYPEMELMAAVTGYRRLLDSEEARRHLFADGMVPRFFSEQPEHVHMRLNAILLMREKRGKEASELLAKAHETAPPIKGKLNDKPFESLRDCDDLFGSVIEVFAQGGYYWVPLEQVETITIPAPKFPRDLLWLPARLEMKDSAGNVFLPVLYPNSHAEADDQIKLGRATDWKTVDDGPVSGVGAHLFLAGEQDVGLLEWRTLEIE